MFTRGGLGLAASRGHLFEVAGASASASEANPISAPLTNVERKSPPAFTSTLRSWAAVPPAPAALPPTADDAQSALAMDAQSAPLVAENSQAEQAQLYTVAAGDTLSQIADRYSVDVGVLASANHLADSNLLRPGAQLLIPVGMGISGAPLAPPVQIPSQAAAAPPVQVPAAPSPGITAAVADASSPDAAVRSFYALIETGQLDRAAGLWSQRMRGAYPPAENIHSRFARTRALNVLRAEVVHLDTTSGRATVAVRVSEVVGQAPALTREYVGNWYLVRGSDGWLLDQPSLQQT